MKKNFFVIIMSLLLLSCSPAKVLVPVTWSDNLTGDYSFVNQWSFPEGIYRNSHGEPVCDGICPPGSYEMLDNGSRINPNSIYEYYKLVDTTHQYYSIQCESNCYEFSGTDFIIARKLKPDSIECYTECNASTHCTLKLIITQNICIPTIELNPISSPGRIFFSCTEGLIKIDSALWNKDILKAEFNFKFRNTENKEEPIFWRGKIYTPIFNPIHL
jgi:hypothetical protein